LYSQDLLKKVDSVPSGKILINNANSILDNGNALIKFTFDGELDVYIEFIVS